MAAVDLENGAADKARMFGGEEHDRLRDLGCLAGAARGQLGVQLRPAVLVAQEPRGARHDVRQVAAGQRRPRIDGDDAYIVPHALAAEALGEHVERDIGHAAGNIAVVRRPRGGAHDVDDDTAAARAHARIDNAREIDIAEDLDVPGLAPGLAVDIDERAGRDVARIVDQNIDVGAGAAQCLDLAGLAEVAAVDRHRHAVLAGEPPRELP